MMYVSNKKIEIIFFIISLILSLNGYYGVFCDN